MNVPGPKLSAIPSEIRSCAADPKSDARIPPFVGVEQPHLPLARFR